MDEAILFVQVQILSPQPEKHLISSEIRCFFTF